VSEDEQRGSGRLLSQRQGRRGRQRQRKKGRQKLACRLGWLRMCGRNFIHDQPTKLKRI
jgi:hypothetical protein